MSLNVITDALQIQVATLPKDSFGYAQATLSFTFRRYDDAQDRQQVLDLFSQVFRGGEPVPEEREVEDEDKQCFLYKEGGQVLAAFVLIRMTCSLSGLREELPCGGIQAVAVRPEARRSGLASAMMRFAMGEMRRQGYAISSLYGFRESFYRRLGWEVCGVRYKITCPSARLPATGVEMPVREVLGDEPWKEVEHVYDAFASRYSGMNRRSPRQWKHVMRGTGGQARVYAIGEPIEAYCVLHITGDFWDEQPLSQVAWSTPEGYRAILTFLRSVAANKTAISWFEPGDSPLLALYLDQGVTAAINRPIMFRILDVEKALRPVFARFGGGVSIRVNDPDIQENSRSWRLDEYGVSACEEGDIRLGIGALTQALLGEPSFGDLVRHGAVQCGSEDALAKALRVFPPGRSFCMDFF